MRRTQNLAFVFQELLTVGERLRTGRQPVNDARQFRAQLLAALDSAIEEGKQRGYAAEDVELCAFAVVAFLDESVLNTGADLCRLAEAAFAGATLRASHGGRDLF